MFENENPGNFLEEIPKRISNQRFSGLKDSKNLLRSRNLQGFGLAEIKGDLE